MKSAGIWLCAASALTLSACHRPQQAAARRPASVAVAAAPQRAPAAAGTPSAAAARASGVAASAPRATAAHLRTLARTASPITARAGDVFVATQDGRPGSGRTTGSSVPDDHELSAEYQSCISSARGVTVDRASCHSAEFARQGARMERAYSAALATRSGPAKARLMEDQRAWLALRDSRCREDASGRALDVLNEGSCRLSMTIQRANKLGYTG